jgi:hypothetical protein
MMIHHQLLPIPQLLLQHIIVTSKDYLNGEPFMFHGILPAEKCAAPEKFPEPLDKHGTDY